GQPTRFLEQIPYPVTPLWNAQKVVFHLDIMADVGVNRIPAIKRSRYAISRLFFFLLESAKHTIPDYERTCVVFINVLWVTPMMDTMMRWRIKDKLEPSRQLSDCFRVNP